MQIRTSSAYGYVAPVDTGQQAILNHRESDALKYAISNNELCVHYQPRYDVKAGRTKIIEALVRWSKPGVGIVYPGEFIDAAIRHKVIFSLDTWVFKQCCEDLKWIRKHYDRELKIAVNITAMECENLHHTQRIIDTCESFGLQLSDFEFEITESVYIRDARKVKAFCQTFVDKGANISLDDFGTGQSPLSSLCDFPVDTIKIDRSFVEHMESKSRIQIIVGHMIEIAHEMRLNIVAEGIETKKQFIKLKQLGCHQLQGYHISRPLVRHLLLPYLVMT